MEQYQHTGRKMRRNHSNAIPRYVIAFDAETKREQIDMSATLFGHSFRIGVATSCRIRGTESCEFNTQRFTDTESFWQYVYGKTGSNYTTWLVCHNALFDMVIAGFPEELQESRVSIDWPRSIRKREDNNEDNVHCSTMCIIDSPPTVIAVKCQSTQGRLVIVDTMNWFPVSLKTLGTECGIEKLPMPDWDEPDETWFTYCERDVKITLTSFLKLIAWVKENDLGMFRYTAASQAMSAYRHRFAKHEVFFHDSIPVKQLERKAYYGGRTEVFRRGPTNCTVWQLDTNSLFPSVMRLGEFPSKLVRFELKTSFRPEIPEINWSKSIAEVDMLTIEPIFPMRRNGATIYPVGRFKTSLAGPELALAHKLGCIRGVSSWSEYETEVLFDYWVESIWAMRSEFKQSGNRLYEQFAKRLLNSLYGKFAQRSPQWVNVEGSMAGLPWSSWTEPDSKTGESVSFRSIGWQIQRAQERGEIEGTFPAISAFTTAYARLRMNQLRKIAGRMNCYYQGIDSLIVTREGLQRLELAGEVSETELGRMRIQLHSDTGIIWEKMDYEIGDKVAISGRSTLVEIAEATKAMQRKFAVASLLFRGRPAAEVMEEITPWERQHCGVNGVPSRDGWQEAIVI